MPSVKKGTAAAVVVVVEMLAVVVVIFVAAVVVVSLSGAFKMVHGSQGMQSVWKATMQESDGSHAATHSVASAITVSWEQTVLRLAGGDGMIMQPRSGMQDPHCALHGAHSSVSWSMQGMHVEQFSKHALVSGELQLTTVCS